MFLFPTNGGVGPYLLQLLEYMRSFAQPPGQLIPSFAVARYQPAQINCLPHGFDEFSRWSPYFAC